MQLELAQYIVNQAIETGNYDEEEVRVYENYSGRGMYGRTTAGVVGLTGSEIACMVLQFAQECDLTEELEDLEIPTTFSEDSLGRSMIIY